MAALFVLLLCQIGHKAQRLFLPSKFSLLLLLAQTVAM